MNTAVQDQQWPDALDALIAAPEHHKLLFENELVRVLDTCIRAGETTALHAHRWPATLYVLSWSDFVRRDASGIVILDSRMISAPASGTAMWSAGLAPHTLENIGVNDLRVIAVELRPDLPVIPAPAKLRTLKQFLKRRANRLAGSPGDAW